jgi:hypothetical protein
MAQFVLRRPNATFKIIDIDEDDRAAGRVRIAEYMDKGVEVFAIRDTPTDDYRLKRLQIKAGTEVTTTVRTSVEFEDQP